MKDVKNAKKNVKNDKCTNAESCKNWSEIWARPQRCHTFRWKPRTVTLHCRLKLNILLHYCTPNYEFSIFPKRNITVHPSRKSAAPTADCRFSVVRVTSGNGTCLLDTRLYYALSRLKHFKNSFTALRSTESYNGYCTGEVLFCSRCGGSSWDLFMGMCGRSFCPTTC